MDLLVVFIRRVIGLFQPPAFQPGWNPVVMAQQGWTCVAWGVNALVMCAILAVIAWGSYHVIAVMLGLNARYQAGIAAKAQAECLARQSELLEKQNLLLEWQTEAMLALTRAISAGAKPECLALSARVKWRRRLRR